MKKMVLVFTLAAFALSGSAFAQDPNYFDNIGLYMTPGGYADPGAEDGTGSCGYIEAYDAPFNVYVVLSRLTSNEVWHWEAKLAPTNMTYLGYTLYGQAINIGDINEYEWAVGLATPLFAVDNAVVVCELEYMIWSWEDDLAQPSTMTIGALYYPSIDGVPSYLVNEGGPLRELHPALDSEIQLTINGPCEPVAVESSSWGSLKSLYR